MKKFLSLVLALVMTMSLVTVSAGAEDFNDVEDIKYVEAVDVLSAIGVIDGMPDGSFQPKAGLTRAQAAKIICYLNLSPKTAATLSADTAPFADVAATDWAAGYIAEGVQSGIIAGVGNGLFAPNAELTGFAYLKMLLVCLGYDAVAEGMTGANWSVNVAKLAKKVGLTKGNDDFVGSAVVTREEAALYALNALKARPVYYPNGTGTEIVVNGVVISTGASAAEKDPEYKEYMDINYGRLSYDDGDVDSYGRPSISWVFKGEDIGTYAETPVLVYTESVKGEDVADDLKAEGYKKAGSKLVAIDDDTYEGVTGNGRVVEFYGDTKTDDDDKDVDYIKAVIVVDTYAAQVQSLVKDKSRTEDKDERAITLTDGTKIVADDEVTKDGIELDNFEDLYDLEKKDWVLVSKAGKKVVAVEAAEVIEGEATKYHKDDIITIDGETYEFSANAELDKDADLKGTYNKFDGEFVLDAYGYIIAKGKGSEKDSDVMLLVKAYEAKDKYGEPTYYAQVVTEAGEVEEIVADDLYNKKGDVDLEGALVTYTLNKDDEAVFKAYTDYVDLTEIEIDDEEKFVKDVDGKKAYYADEVTMVYAKNAGAKLKVEVAEELEYLKAKDTAKGAFALTNDDAEIELIFVIGEGKTYADPDELIYVASTKVVEEDYDAETKVIEAYVEGVLEEITLDIDAKVSVGFFNYMIDEDGIYELDKATDLDKATLTQEAILAIRKDVFVTIGEDLDTEYVLSDDAVVIDLSENDLVDLAGIKAMAEELKEDGGKEILDVTVLFDAEDEVIDFVVIDVVDAPVAE